MALVERYMIGEVKALAASAPVGEAAALLAEEKVRSVLVVDAAGRLIGQVEDAQAGARTVGEAAGPAPLAVPRDADAQETLERMQRDDLRRMVVVDEVGRPVGIVPRAMLERRLQHDLRRGRA